MIVSLCADCKEPIMTLGGAAGREAIVIDAQVAGDGNLVLVGRRAEVAVYDPTDHAAYRRRYRIHQCRQPSLPEVSPW